MPPGPRPGPRPPGPDPRSSSIVPGSARWCWVVTRGDPWAFRVSRTGRTGRESSRTRAGRPYSGDGRLQVNAPDVGQGHQPGQDVGHLQGQFLGRPRPEGRGQLADFLGQPENVPSRPGPRPWPRRGRRSAAEARGSSGRPQVVRSSRPNSCGLGDLANVRTDQRVAAGPPGASQDRPGAGGCQGPGPPGGLGACTPGGFVRAGGEGRGGLKRRSEFQIFLPSPLGGRGVRGVASEASTAGRRVFLPSPFGRGAGGEGRGIRT